MLPSEKALALIKRFESLRLESYLCPAGVWTIGWGTTRGIRPGMTIPPEFAGMLLARDVDEARRTS